MAFLNPDYALDKIGALDFGLNPFDKPDKVRKDASDINPKMIITTDYSYGNFKDLDKTLNFDTLVYDPSKDSRSLVFKSLYKIGKLKNKIDANIKHYFYLEKYYFQML